MIKRYSILNYYYYCINIQSIKDPDYMDGISNKRFFYLFVFPPEEELIQSLKQKSSRSKSDRPFCGQGAAILLAVPFFLCYNRILCGAEPPRGRQVILRSVAQGTLNQSSRLLILLDSSSTTNLITTNNSKSRLTKHYRYVDYYYMHSTVDMVICSIIYIWNVLNFNSLTAPYYHLNPFENGIQILYWIQYIKNRSSSKGGNIFTK